MATTRQYYGFPWQIENGRIQALSLNDYVKHQISERLMQPLGKRFFQERIGSRILSLRRMPVNPVLYSAMELYIYEALRELPIDIQSITPLDSKDGRVEVSIRYAHANIQNQEFTFDITSLING